MIKYGKWISDKTFLKIYFFLLLGRKLDIETPKTFSEKLQWLKLKDRKPLYSVMADKFLVKDYVANKIGSKYLIPTIGVYDSFEDINFEILPQSFVMKCTHDSGGLVICKNKNELDFKQAKQKINKSLRRNYFYLGREWVYKDIKPRVIIEKYMSENERKDLKDYKIFCFNGEPKIIQVDFDRYTNHKRNIYDIEWNLLDFKLQYPRDENAIINKPYNLSELLDLSRILSRNIPFLRVDFYVIESELFFGELTFYPESGILDIFPFEWEYILGDMLKLSIE